MVKEKEEVKEKPEDDTEGEAKEETNNLITTANEAAVRIENANKEMTKNLDRQERMKVEQTLAGKAEAGEEPKKKEESASDYADKVMAGQHDEGKD